MLYMIPLKDNFFQSFRNAMSNKTTQFVFDNNIFVFLDTFYNMRKIYLSLQP